MKTTVKISLLAFFALSLILSGCNTDGCTDIYAVNYDAEAKNEDNSCEYPDLMVGFDYKVGDEDFAYNQVYTINGTAVSFSLAQFYISGVRMMGPDLTYDVDDSYALVTPDGGMYNIGAGKVTHTHMMRFNLGVDSSTNTQSEVDFASWPMDHPLAVQSPNMHWNWNAGYIFLKLEGEVDTDNDGTPDAPLVAHTGTNGLLRTVALEIHKDVEKSSEMIHLKVDWAKLFTNIDLTTNSITHTGDNRDLAVSIMDNFATAFSMEH